MSSVFSSQSLMDSNLHHKPTTHNSPKLAVFSQKCFCSEMTCSSRGAELLSLHPRCSLFKVWCPLIAARVSGRAEQSAVATHSWFPFLGCAAVCTPCSTDRPCQCLDIGCVKNWKIFFLLLFTTMNSHSVCCSCEAGWEWWALHNSWAVGAL